MHVLLTFLDDGGSGNQTPSRNGRNEGGVVDREKRAGGDSVQTGKKRHQVGDLHL